MSVDETAAADGDAVAVAEAAAPTPAPAAETAIRIDHLTKRYGDLFAVRDLSAWRSPGARSTD